MKLKILVLLCIAMVVLVATASAKTITVDDDLSECPFANYTSIQDAINDATEGDIIQVYSGTYEENVVVNKTLNLTGIGMPVIDGMNKGNTIKIEADNCTISGFKIINSAGDWNLAGIHIASSNNLIFNNTISSNKGHGIGIYSGNNEIYSNTIYSNGWAGVGIYAGGNKIYENDIQDNGYGIRLFQAGGNIIFSNIIKNNGYGFYLYASSSNVIYSNIVSSNGEDAFYIWSSSGNRIYENEISGSATGLEIWICSSGNAVYENAIVENGNGVYIYYPSYASNNNLFYHNDFIENSENNTWDECRNRWYNETLREGNYYDDYNGTDADGDGIGDVPYNISGGTNRDLYPLMRPYVSNEPPVASFTFSPARPVVDEVVTFDASASFDPDGTIVSYEWDFGDGTNGTGKVVNHSFASEGNYSVVLTVTDDGGAKNSTARVVEVRAAAKPSVSVSTDKYEYAAGDTMLVSLTLENPTDSALFPYFLWRLDLPDYDLHLPIVVRRIYLPPGCEKNASIPVRMGNWRISFNASWYVALIDATTHEVISEDVAEWRYTCHEMVLGDCRCARHHERSVVASPPRTLTNI
ncbi:MAG: Nitrous oxide reductase accessory protein NosD [Candidatus Alkanophagales archaeon MCA70_species_1]|nr:Nitrous oxide reductase accessory protein NosD [Candidatus Alkanophaga volatiphilum]